MTKNQEEIIPCNFCGRYYSHEGGCIKLSVETGIKERIKYSEALLEIDLLKEKLALAVEALERSRDFCSVISDWDSFFPNGIEMADDEWIRPYEIVKEIDEAISKIRG